jgi:hypothetical protein
LVFEEAMKIRATEEFEDIDLGGHGTGTAEQPLAPAKARAPQADACAVMLVGADVTEVMQENTSISSSGSHLAGGGRSVRDSRHPNVLFIRKATCRQTGNNIHLFRLCIGLGILHKD